jgi:monofunctional biosynthetic peptidoglycan transglycosylase
VEAFRHERCLPVKRLLRRIWLLVFLSAAGFAAWQVLTWPDVERLAKENPKTTAFVERWTERERAAGRSVEMRLRFVPYARISDELKLAVVVGEDIDFFTHEGFATAEIRASLEKAWAEKEIPRGASTITQQLVKNLWLSPSRSPWRKVKEALLTREVEQKLDKRRILELYLNVVELGPGVWGCENAARRYFGKGASELGSREAAMLAAALPRPSAWHPGSRSRGYSRQVDRILARMRGSDWVRGEL